MAAYRRGWVSRSVHNVTRDGDDCWGASHESIVVAYDRALGTIAELRDARPHDARLQKALAKAAAEIRREMRRHLRRRT